MKSLKIFLITFIIFLSSYSSNIISAKNNSVKPKNVIIMIADGWGFNHILATEYYTGEKPIYKEFDVAIAMSTYPAQADNSSIGYDPEKAWTDFKYLLEKPTDSAASATAMSCGVKTYNGAIGVDLEKNPVEHVSELAKKIGKSIGVVSSVIFTDATPSGFAVHNELRKNYKEIAYDLFYRSNLDVLMGGGHPDYDKNGELREEKDYSNVGGETSWNALKTGDYSEIRKELNISEDQKIEKWTLIESKEDFEKLIQGDTPKRVLGIPRVAQTLQYARMNDSLKMPFEAEMISSVPDLTTIALGAINILDDNEKGFFLMIEGGAVDWASHGNNTGRMIEEMIDFNKAVQAVVNKIEESSSWNETLLIVTGDHECGYLWGPNSGDGQFNDIVDNGKGNLPGVDWYSGGHSNSLIPFFAKGAGSEIFLESANRVDPKRGSFIDNVMIAKNIFKFWE